MITITRPYLVYVHNTLAERRMTLKFAIKTAIRFQSSYVIDERIGKIVWEKGKSI